ncbi:MAG: hypothetical protein WB626_07520, partial [Bacteroidota bacterium]
PLEHTYTPGRGLGLGYRRPAGWMDASADSALPAVPVRLLRTDFAAWLTIGEVRVAGGVEDIRELARAALALDTAGAAFRIFSPVEGVEAGGKRAAAYETVGTSSPDTVRTVLFEMQGRFYEVRALAGAGRAGREEVFSTQQRLVETLAW